LSSTSGFPESEETDGNFIKYIIMGDEIWVGDYAAAVIKA
jgi:hypothetical protein